MLDCWYQSFTLIDDVFKRVILMTLCRGRCFDGTVHLNLDGLFTTFLMLKTEFSTTSATAVQLEAMLSMSCTLTPRFLIRVWTRSMILVRINGGINSPRTMVSREIRTYHVNGYCLNVNWTSPLQVALPRANPSGRDRATVRLTEMESGLT